jgi:CHAT domain/NACHT domain
MPLISDHENFDIELHSLPGSGEFEARVLRSPLRLRAEGQRFNPPYSNSELEQFLSILEDSTRASTSRHFDLEYIAAKQPIGLQCDAAEIGRKLFTALFFGSIETEFWASKVFVQSGRDASSPGQLRVRLIFGRKDLGQLGTLPWELLRDKEGQYLALDPSTPIVRSHQGSGVPKRIAKPPLRVLLAESRPSDQPALGTGQEVELITARLIENKLIRPTHEKHMTLKGLRAKLEKTRCHVLHFMGHGDFVGEGRDDFALCFEDEDGKTKLVSGDTLAQNLTGLPNLRLVVLSSCWSAALPRRHGQDPYTGVAIALRDIPAIVAMQFPISDGAAITFADAFYGRIARGDSVCTAVTEGRLAIFNRDDHSLEWATPALFLAGDDHLFDVSSGTEQPNGATVTRSSSAGAEASTAILPASSFRRRFDRLFPALHRCLTILHILPRPRELPAIRDGLTEISRSIDYEALREKIYFPLLATRERVESQRRKSAQRFRDQLLSVAGGSSERGRPIRHLERTIRGSHAPLVITGAPGSGKTLTLQQIALSLLRQESQRLFPRLVLYVRVGEFHVDDGVPTPADVRRLVRKACPASLQGQFDDLLNAGRLIVLFDGLDEMSREGYNDHTGALSKFALEVTSWGGLCVLTCRRDDLSPELMYDQLVLLPYTRSQIRKYLRRSYPSGKAPLAGQWIGVRKLAGMLAFDGEGANASNPFVLSLYPLFLDNQRDLPRSRMELLGKFVESVHDAKRRKAHEEGLPPLLDLEVAAYAWARIAWHIIKRNRGAEVPIDLLAQDSGRPRDDSLLAAIEAGKACGILQESLEGKKDHVRFVHHIYQEYFAARWIERQHPAIQWLEKLDAPRWQETMLDAVLLGCAGEGVDSLAAAITAELRDLEAFLSRQVAVEPPPSGSSEAFPAESQPADEPPPADPANDATPQAFPREAMLADRVILGARILAEGAKVSPALGRQLQPGVTQAIALLGVSGNPGTQVKMMRACQSLEDSAVSALLLPTFDSPVRWMREQALSRIATDLPTHMGIYLATCAFLPQWLVFLRAVRVKGWRPSWLAALALATTWGLVHIAALAACASALGRGTLVSLRIFFDTDLGRPVLSEIRRSGTEKLLAAQTLIAVVVALVSLATRPSRLTFWCLASAPLSLAALYLGAGLWHNNWETVAVLFVVPWLALPIPLMMLAGAGVHGLVLTGYCLASWPLRRTEPIQPTSIRPEAIGSREPTSLTAPPRQLSLLSFLKISWAECGYGSNAALLGRVLKFGPLVLLILSIFSLIVGVGYFGFSSAVEWLSGKTGLPYKDDISELGLVALIAALAYVGYCMRASPDDRPLLLRLLRGLLKGFLGVGRVALVFAVSTAFAAGVTFLLEGGFEYLGDGLDRLPAISKAFVLLLSVYTLIWLANRFLIRTTDYMTNPKTWTPDGWTARLRSLPPRDQAYFLRSTNHERLHIDRAEFLELLANVEPLITAEPAQSAYWSCRAQVDEALRQERRGSDSDTTPHSQ